MSEARDFYHPIRHSRALDASERRAVRRILARSGAKLGFVGAALVFVVSLFLWAVPNGLDASGLPMLAGEAIGLVTMGPLAGALLGASSARLSGVFLALFSVTFCAITTVPTGLVAATIWHMFEPEIAIAEGVMMAIMGGLFVSPLLVLYGIIVAVLLARQRDPAALWVAVPR